MTRGDLLGEALRALEAHRLRASLSSIGIVFGVATIVAALAIGDGARQEAFDEIGSLGINNIFVRAVRPPVAAPAAEPPAPVLTVSDAAALKALPGVAGVSGVRAARADVSTGSRRMTTMLAGVTPDWMQIGGPRIADGRWIVDRDVDGARRVAVIGARLAAQLFGGHPAVGQRILAGGAWFQVIGVLQPVTTARLEPGSAAVPAVQPDTAGNPEASPIGRFDRDTAAIVPLTAMDLPLGRGDRTTHVEEIAVAADAPDRVERLAAAIDGLMRRRHDTDGWELVVPQELLDARMRAERVFSAVLIGIGGLALLISGIGIMNIMLASVAERTQEIGVRRAFGARATEVIAQFAVEATLLSVGGGLVGVPAGIAIAALVAIFAGWPVAISFTSVALALCVAVGVGLGFGVYPARVAARVQPIDALRAP